MDCSRPSASAPLPTRSPPSRSTALPARAGGTRPLPPEQEDHEHRAYMRHLGERIGDSGPGDVPVEYRITITLGGLRRSPQPREADDDEGHPAGHAQDFSHADLSSRGASGPLHKVAISRRCAGSAGTGVRPLGRTDRDDELTGLPGFRKEDPWQNTAVTASNLNVRSRRNSCPAKRCMVWQNATTCRATLSASGFKSASRRIRRRCAGG